MEGYKPQDFSFFHRSEKLVQQNISINTIPPMLTIVKEAGKG